MTGIATLTITATHQLMYWLSVITYVYADHAGSVHDERVLHVSSLVQKLDNGQIGGANDKYHLQGDSAFPLLPNLRTLSLIHI